MSEHLNERNFSEQLGTIFRVETSSSSLVELKLVEVQGASNGLPEVAGQERFALYFTGSNEQFLQQRSYSLRHQELGDLEIFLVPIAQDENGFRYEAVFNRLAS